jgi:carbon storage regulator
MLVLSRKIGEQVVIDDNIRVTVLAINGQTIRLGFEAPRNVPILRAELAEAVPPAPVSCTAKGSVGPTLTIAAARVS